MTNSEGQGAVWEEDIYKGEERGEMSTESDHRPGVAQLKGWINKSMKVEMSDGRVIVGVFLCTDRLVSGQAFTD